MERDAEEGRLQALGALGLLDTPREERFDRLVRLAQRLFDVPMGVVSLLDEDRWWVKAEAGLAGTRELPRSQSTCARTVQADAPLMVTDVRLDSRFGDYPMVAERGVRFYAGEPLRAPGGCPVGTLCIVDARPRGLDPNQRQVLLQRNLLPRTTPDLPGYEVAGVCLPASVVGGDFYDWYAVEDGFQVVLADVMGKGVAAALLGAAVRSLMRGASRFNDLETAVNRVGFSIESDLVDTSSFVTLMATRLDPVAHVLTYVDAGHGLAGVVTHDGRLQMLRSDGLPLGAPVLEPWRAERIRLAPGDTFVAVSDGALDLFESFHDAREAIRAAVHESRHAQEVVDIVAAYATEHRATDDVTCVVVRREEER
jgi:hypothetical protein